MNKELAEKAREYAENLANKWCEEDNQPASFQHTYHGAINGYQEGYSLYEKDLLDKSAEGFEEWFEAEWKDYNGKIGTFKTVQENCFGAYSAATLATEKRHKGEVEELREYIKCNGLPPYLDHWRDGNKAAWFSRIQSINVQYQRQISNQEDEIQKLKRDLDQQRFNNAHNLSIDQKVSDEIVRLKQVIKEMAGSLQFVFNHSNNAGDRVNIKRELDKHADVIKGCE